MRNLKKTRALFWSTLNNNKNPKNKFTYILLCNNNEYFSLWY